MSELQPGETVVYEGGSYVYVASPTEDVALIATEAGKVLRVLEDMLTSKGFVKREPNNIFQVSEKDWNIANNRLKVILPLLGGERTLEDVKKIASSEEVHFTTVYRWLNRFIETETLTSLIPSQHRGGKGKKRIKDDVENVITEVIDSFYLSMNKPSVSKAYMELKYRCYKNNLPIPHVNTLRNRIKSLPTEKVFSKRLGKKKAKAMFRPHQGKFPGAEVPLSVVQIDHTPLDVILVDEKERKPFRRPWITLAMDVFSRMVVGYYLSYEKPSYTSVGMCVANSILPKYNLLTKLDIETSWPVEGCPSVIHVDNAKEFRSKDFMRACDNYLINIEWRPVAVPHYGGHVERLLGTFAKDIHNLPGTTFSNTQEKGDYKSEKHAALTLSEFEKWLVTNIVEIYHQVPHSETKLPPIKAFNDAVFGDDNNPGIGLPRLTYDEYKLRLDFLPSLERTVQRYGIAIDDIYYYSDVLRHWCNARESGDKGNKKKFLIRRDPRDLSKIFFFDPVLEQYLEIPYRDITHPKMNIWELREAKKKLKEQGYSSVNEKLIFEAYERMQNIKNSAIRQTNKIRKSDKKPSQLNQKSRANHIDELVDEVTPFADVEYK